MAKRKLTKAEREESKAFHEQMLANARRTRELLGLIGLAELVLGVGDAEPCRPAIGCVRWHHAIGRDGIGHGLAFTGHAVEPNPIGPGLRR